MISCPGAWKIKAGVFLRFLARIICNLTSKQTVGFKRGSLDLDLSASEYKVAR